MRLHSPSLIALLPLVSLVTAQDSNASIFSVATRFLRDVQLGLNAILDARSSPAPTQKRAISVKPYCVAERSAQAVFGSNGTVIAPGTPDTPGSSNASSSWNIAQHYSGNSFFDGWKFFTDADPTNGVVDYVDEGTARSTGLALVNNAGNAVMKVDTTQIVTGNRKSVRIFTQYAFTGGLVILDAVHIPTGCGTWPAFWSDGPTWPQNGEIDIVEGVNDVNINQATIHTRAGCTVPPTAAEAGASGTLVGGYNCDSGQSGNAGCGSQISSPGNNYGPGFNSNGGGVYAMLWAADAISVWFFPRSFVPSDITAQAPQPSGWGQPFARWPGTNCDTMSFFRNHNAIFDTTLCGDWAGNVWNSAGAPGQEQSCAQRTGFSTCQAYVQQRGDAFADAYWEVKSVTIYQPK